MLLVVGWWASDKIAKDGLVITSENKNWNHRYVSQRINMESHPNIWIYMDVLSDSFMVP